MPANFNVAAVISSVLTFLLTFIITFIIGCTCGVCFNKKCMKPKANESQHPIPVYEAVLSKDIEKTEHSTVAVELKQNVSYAPISMS